MLTNKLSNFSCCWYHKGTNFQANHNYLSIVYIHLMLLLIPQRYEFSSKSQRAFVNKNFYVCCCWYHKGTNFQANHNWDTFLLSTFLVVADTTKVRIFKQITTSSIRLSSLSVLLLIPQRYEFSSKSQHILCALIIIFSCCWYHKGTNFQANHNRRLHEHCSWKLLLIPQRYEFSSKSQLSWWIDIMTFVVADTTKVRIFKQITTQGQSYEEAQKLLLIPQRYEFSSKSQLRVRVSYL